MKVKEDELEIIIRKQGSRQIFQPQWEKMTDLSSRRKEEEILLTAKMQKLLLERLTSKGGGREEFKKISTSETCGVHAGVSFLREARGTTFES